MSNSPPTDTFVSFLLTPLVDDLLKGHDFIEVSPSTAAAILLVTKNKSHCHVQLPSDPDAVDVYGKQLSKPRLWNLVYWNASVERFVKAKIKADQERIQRAIYLCNCERITKVLLRKYPLTYDMCNTIARRWLDGKKYYNVHAIGIDKIIDKWEDVR